MTDVLGGLFIPISHRPLRYGFWRECLTCCRHFGFPTSRSAGTATMLAAVRHHCLRAPGKALDRRELADADGHGWVVPVLRNPAFLDVGAVYRAISLFERVPFLSACALSRRPTGRGAKT